jgi:hypothetical protein
MTRWENPAGPGNEQNPAESSREETPVFPGKPNTNKACDVRIGVDERLFFGAPETWRIMQAP